MASPESKRLRRTLVNDRGSVGTPIGIQRQDWEAAAEKVSLPPGISIMPVNMAGIPGEWLACTGNQTKGNAILFLHGGGFTQGSCKTHRGLAAYMAQATAMEVLTINYRLAPEFPFPAALDDVITAYQWLLGNGFSANQIVIAGDSAGAGLAMACLAKLRDRSILLPVCVVLLSPWVDLALSGSSVQSRADIDPLVSVEGLQEAVDNYLGDHDPADPSASPLYDDLHGMPAMLIHVGDHEILLSDATRLAEKAASVGVDVQLDIWEEMWHVWHAWAQELPEAQAALVKIAQFITSRLQ